MALEGDLGLPEEVATVNTFWGETFSDLEDTAAERGDPMDLSIQNMAEMTGLARIRNALAEMTTTEDIVSTSDKVGPWRRNSELSVGEGFSSVTIDLQKRDGSQYETVAVDYKSLRGDEFLEIRAQQLGADSRIDLRVLQEPAHDSDILQYVLNATYDSPTAVRRATVREYTDNGIFVTTESTATNMLKPQKPV